MPVTEGSIRARKKNEKISMMRCASVTLNSSFGDLLRLHRLQSARFLKYSIYKLRKGQPSSTCLLTVSFD